MTSTMNNLTARRKPQSGAQAGPTSTPMAAGTIQRRPPTGTPGMGMPYPGGGPMNVPPDSIPQALPNPGLGPLVDNGGVATHNGGGGPISMPAPGLGPLVDNGGTATHSPTPGYPTPAGPIWSGADADWMEKIRQAVIKASTQPIYGDPPMGDFPVRRRSIL